MMKVKSVVAAGVTAAMGAGIVMAGPSVARAYINEDGRGALAAGFRGVKSAHGGREIGTFVVNGQRVVCALIRARRLPVIWAVLASALMRRLAI